jgi:3-hydroxyisobutyrate dehydrogenase
MVSAEDRALHTIGFIGIGTMGAPMVRCLANSGFKPELFDIDSQAAKNTAQQCGLNSVDSIEEIAGRLSIAILMLPNSSIVRSVCTGQGGLAAGMPENSIIIDMSSSDPVETRKLGAELESRSITLLDAPVSGGVRKAVSGTLAIMLGGNDKAAVDTVTPVLEAMGTIYRAGPLGAGHATKALNNYVSAAGLAAACEAMIIGEAFGLEPQRMTDILNASTGRNNSTENKLAQFILSDKFREAGFSLELMAKDVNLAAGLSAHVNKPLPGVNAAAGMWSEADNMLEPEADHTEIFRYLQALHKA